MRTNSEASLPILERVRIASPCRASWEDMAGDDRSRFCGSCQKHVYNFAAMTSVEIEKLIIEKEWQLCGRFYRRADGTIMTADCPVGLVTARKKALRLVACIAATFVFALQAFAYLLPAGKRARIREFEPFATIASRLSPRPAPVPILVFGDISIAPPQKPIVLQQPAPAAN